MCQQGGAAGANTRGPGRIGDTRVVKAFGRHQGACCAEFSLSGTGQIPPAGSEARVTRGLSGGFFSFKFIRHKGRSMVSIVSEKEPGASSQETWGALTQPQCRGRLGCRPQARGVGSRQPFLHRVGLTEGHDQAKATCPLNPALPVLSLVPQTLSDADRCGVKPLSFQGDSPLVQFNNAQRTGEYMAAQY